MARVQMEEGVGGLWIVITTHVANTGALYQVRRLGYAGILPATAMYLHVVIPTQERWCSAVTHGAQARIARVGTFASDKCDLG
jgi:hypothetical protein